MVVAVCFQIIHYHLNCGAARLGTIVDVIKRAQITFGECKVAQVLELLGKEENATVHCVVDGAGDDSEAFCVCGLYILAACRS